MTTYLPRVPFVNCRQFMYLVISLLVLRAGYGIWLYQFLIIAYLFTDAKWTIAPPLIKIEGKQRLFSVHFIRDRKHVYLFVLGFFTLCHFDWTIKPVDQFSHQVNWDYDCSSDWYCQFREGKIPDGMVENFWLRITSMNVRRKKSKLQIVFRWCFTRNYRLLTIFMSPFMCLNYNLVCFYNLSQLMRLWYLSHRPPAKAQISRRRVRPKIKHLAPMNGWLCMRV